MKTREEKGYGETKKVLGEGGRKTGLNSSLRYAFLHGTKLAESAKATIMVLRVPRAFSVRARNHCAKALSFWNMRNRHANWIMPRRTRALPERASPFSRRLVPLSSGEGGT